MADRQAGSQTPVFITLAVYIPVTAVTALSWDLWSFMLFRLLAGSGGEDAAINAMVEELVPARARGWVDLVINGSFWIGATLGRDCLPHSSAFRAMFVPRRRQPAPKLVVMKFCNTPPSVTGWRVFPWPGRCSGAPAAPGLFGWLNETGSHVTARQGYMPRAAVMTDAERCPLETVAGSTTHRRHDVHRANMFHAPQARFAGREAPW